MRKSCWKVWGRQVCLPNLIETVVRCSAGVTQTAAATSADCLKEVMGMIPDNLQSIFTGCYSADSCLNKLKAAREQLINTMSEWVEDKRETISAEGTQYVDAMMTGAQQLMDEMEAIASKISGAANALGGFFSDARQHMGNIFEEYGDIDDKDFCSSNFPSFEISDCGAFGELKTLLANLHEVYQITGRFDSVRSKLSSCVTKTFEVGSAKVPTPFMDISKTSKCVPQAMRDPIRGIVAALRYAFVNRHAAAAGLASLVSDVQSIFGSFSAFLRQRLSKLALLQGEGESETCSDFGAATVEVGFSPRMQATAVALQGAIAIQGRLTCQGGKLTTDLLVLGGVDFDLLTSKPLAIKKTGSVVIAFGYSPPVSNPLGLPSVKMGAVSGGALMKLAARGIPCPPLNLPNKCGGGLAFGLSRTPAFKFFFGYTLLKIVAVPPPLPLPDASILGGVAVSVCLTCPFTKKTGAPVTSGPKIVYTLHHVSTCWQCGREWCHTFWQDEFGLANKPGYKVGSTLAEWGCDKVHYGTKSVHDKTTGDVYAMNV